MYNRGFELMTGMLLYGLILLLCNKFETWVVYQGLFAILGILLIEVVFRFRNMSLESIINRCIGYFMTNGIIFTIIGMIVY